MQIETEGEGRKGRGGQRYREGEVKEMERAKDIPRETGTERETHREDSWTHTHRPDIHINLHDHRTQRSAVAGNWASSGRMAGTASFCVRLCRLNSDLTLS